MRFLFLSFFLLAVAVSSGQGVIVLQDKPFIYSNTRDTLVWNQLSANAAFHTLSEAEQEFFYWSNLMRRNPALFGETVLKEFLLQFPEANSSDAKSLLSDLKQAKPQLSLLVPDDGLIKMARRHAADLKKRGAVISHQSSSGKGFVERIKEAGAYRCGAENVFVGSPNPLSALVLLLIDKGVREKGHRKNLLGPAFNLMGASFVSTGKDKVVLVQDFGCK